MNLTRNGLIVLISVIFVAGAGTAYAGIVLPMITLAGDVTITGDMICPGCVDSADIADGATIKAIPQNPRSNTITSVDFTDTGFYSSITIGTDGLPIISYYDGSFGDQNLNVAHCNNLACSIASTKTAIDSTDIVGKYTSITIGTDGLPIISYYDDTHDDLKVAHCDNVTCTSATTNTLDSTDEVGRFTSITIGTDGLPIISYHDDTNSDLKVAHCNDVTCTGAAITTIDSGGFVGRGTSITIGTDGLPIISYSEFGSGTLKVAHCNDVTCTGAVATTIDSDGFVGQYTSITIGTDGLPIISYYDNTNADLKVVHCNIVICNTGTVKTTIDSAGSVGRFISITIGTDGLPIISYGDDTNRDLKVAHCNDVTCTGAAITTIDSAGGSVGQYTSITIGTDGLPIISYEDLSNRDLKVAHCGNEFCIPNWTRR